MKIMVKEVMRKITILLWLGGFGVANFAMAQSNFSVPVTLTNPLSASTLNDVISKIMTALYLVAVPLTAIMAIVGGFQMITSAGNPEKFSQGRKTLMYAAIGFAVVILAGGIVAIVGDLLGANTS